MLLFLHTLYSNNFVVNEQKSDRLHFQIIVIFSIFSKFFCYHTTNSDDAQRQIKKNASGASGKMLKSLLTTHGLLSILKAINNSEKKSCKMC